MRNASKRLQQGGISSSQAFIHEPQYRAHIVGFWIVANRQTSRLCKKLRMPVTFLFGYRNLVFILGLSLIMILPSSLIDSLPQSPTQSVFNSLKFEHALYDNPYIPNITMTSVKEFLLALLATAPSLVAALPKGLGTKAAGTLDSCLTSALSGDSTRAHYPSSATFITDHAKYFNLNLQYLPYAIVYPKTTEEISAVVVCAGSNDKKVQGRSGNLDFANRGMDSSFMFSIHKT